MSEQRQKRRTVAGKGSGTSARVNAAARKPPGTSRPGEDIAFLDEAGYAALVAAADEALARDATKEDALYRKAVALGFLGRPEEAYQIVFSLPEKTGSSPRWVFLGAALRGLAEMLSVHDAEESRKKKMATAAEWLRLAMTLKPAAAASWLTAAEWLKSAGVSATHQVSVLAQGVERPWSDAASLGALGDRLQECGEYAAAASCYDRALGLRGDTTHALTQLAYFMVAWGHADTARVLLGEALAAAPHSREALFALYYLDNQEGRLEDALGHIREVNALRRSRETGEAEIDLLERLGRSSDEILTLDGFIGSEKDDALRARWMVRKARMLLDGGEAEKAISLARSVCGHYGRVDAALLVWAMALEREGKYSDAAVILDMCPGEAELLADTDYWLTRSYALSATMNSEKALEAAWEAARRSPDDERGWKQVLTLSRTLGQPKDGAVAARHLLECQDESSEFLSAMVLSLMAARSYDAAGQFADRLSATAPKDPDTLYLLGSLYSRIGSRAKADECFAASENAEHGAGDRDNGGGSHGR